MIFSFNFKIRKSQEAELLWLATSFGFFWVKNKDQSCMSQELNFWLNIAERLVIKLLREKW